MTTTTANPASGFVAPLTEEVVSGATQDEAIAVINGKEMKVRATRSGSKIQASVGTVLMDLSGRHEDGSAVALDINGNLIVRPGDVVQLQLTGLLGSSPAEVWLYSTPKKLGSLTVDSTGDVSFDYVIPESLEPGNHRVVLAGKSVLGDTVTVGLPLLAAESEPNENGFRGGVMIWLVLGIFASVGLYLPSQIRRRHR
jgi:hypothetical protein